MSERRFQVLELSPEERQTFLDRVRPGHVVTEDDFRLIQGIVTAVSELVALIERKDMSLCRLRDAVFGKRTEKTAAVFPDPPPGDGATPPPAAPTPKTRRKGHGRHAARRCRGARTVAVAHPQFHPGDPCPDCQDAKLYNLPPAPILRLVGQAPVAATCFELERLRRRQLPDRPGGPTRRHP